MEEKLIPYPLSVSKILNMVDFHSPTSGKFDVRRGIDFEEITATYLNQFRLISFESYNHLFTTTAINKVTRWYDGKLHKWYPRNGALFAGIWEKQ